MRVIYNDFVIEWDAGEEDSVVALLSKLIKPKRVATQPKSKKVATQTRNAKIYAERVQGRSKEIRQWAKDNGFSVAKIGFIPNEILDAWENEKVSA